jgi:NADP-dependent 3-hydroxy acid dehydrogenase YdfG
LHFPYDATDKIGAERWVEKTQAQFGRIDGLINSAGMLRIHHIEDKDETALDEMWEVNVKGPLRLTRAALPALKKRAKAARSIWSAWRVNVFRAQWSAMQ